MNAAEKARLEYLRELPRMEIEAEISARLKAADYSDAFNARHSAREIRRAAERAHFLNIIIPLIKAAKRNSGVVPDPVSA